MNLKSQQLVIEVLSATVGGNFYFNGRDVPVRVLQSSSRNG